MLDLIYIMAPVALKAALLPLISKRDLNMAR